MSKDKIRIVVRGCHNQAPFLTLAKKNTPDLPPGIELALLPCSGKIESHQILKFFEQGVDGALIIACPEGACRFVEGNLRAVKRVAYAQEWMEELDLEPDRVKFHMLDSQASEDINEIINTFYSAMCELGPTDLTGL
ncbi:MAG: hydrogenase iron-sulfur subunit [Deltaproteobacteria bacterium]|nr:hydrogenase iron-sulfur subunit [Deltaproteobacteria bacterium]